MKQVSPWLSSYTCSRVPFLVTILAQDLGFSQLPISETINLTIAKFSSGGEAQGALPHLGINGSGLLEERHTSHSFTCLAVHLKQTIWV